MMDTASGLLRRINHGLYGKYLVGDVPNAGNCQVGHFRPFIVGLMYILVAFESFLIVDKSVVMRGNVRSPGPCD